ncbi:MAG: SDR family oxidoreductase [Pseudonocardiaceae bacterium]
MDLNGTVAVVTGAGDGLGGGIARAFAAAGAAAVAHYCASKAAVIHFTRTAALEYGRYGIRVNGVSPGLIWRECLDRDWPDGVARFRQAAPLGRLGRPTDVGNACVFLSMISATVRPSTLPPSLFTGQDPSPLVGDLRSGHRRSVTDGRPRSGTSTTNWRAVPPAAPTFRMSCNGYRVPSKPRRNSSENLLPGARSPTWTISSPTLRLVALSSNSISSPASPSVIATVVRIAPQKVSQTRPAVPEPCRVTITVLSWPSGVRPGNTARYTSAGVLPDLGSEK